MDSRQALLLVGAVLASFFLPFFANAIENLLFIVTGSHDVALGALLEESLKAALVLASTLSIPRLGVAQGLFFGGLAGLGYGLSENFLFVLFLAGSPSLTEVQLFRNAFTLVMHATSAGLFGLFLGKASESRENSFAVIGFAMAVLLHAVFNLSIAGFQ